MAQKRLQEGDTIFNTDHVFYIERQIEQTIREALFASEWCHVLSSNQVGKSSLIVQVGKGLVSQGTRVAFVDISRMGDEFTEEELYFGLSEMIAMKLGLDDPMEYWEKYHKEETPVSRWERFLKENILTFPGNTVICLDEMGMLLYCEFHGEFLSSLSRIHEYRDQRENEGWDRLTFCLSSTTSPGSFKEDSVFKKAKPFWIDHFTSNEAKAFLPFLKGDEQLLNQIMLWTSGHPCMTTKIVKLLSQEEANPHDGKAKQVVDQAVQRLFLSPPKGEGDSLLIHMRCRFEIEEEFYSPEQLRQLISLYQRLLEGDEISFQESWEHITLVVAGLAIEREGKLQIRNRVIERFFSHDFVDKAMRALSSHF